MGLKYFLLECIINPGCGPSEIQISCPLNQPSVPAFVLISFLFPDDADLTSAFDKIFILYHIANANAKDKLNNSSYGGGGLTKSSLKMHIDI